jgi:uncharacterized protein (TIGR02231 family)
VSEIELSASIVAVTVYPDRARVTRRGALRLPPGDHRVIVEPLPLGLHPDSVRVAGRGAGSVLGVDVVHRRHPRTVDAEVAELEEERRARQAELAQLTDEDAVQGQLAHFLEQLAERAGGTFARALAAGDVEPNGLGTFADSLAERLSEVRGRQRALAERRDLANDRLGAIARRLAEMTGRREPDRMAAVVSLAVESGPGAEAQTVAEQDVHLELSYVVNGAGWQSAYDIRLLAERLTLTWYGLVRQQTGEDWPECELSLSTARPAAASSVPELQPWFLDRVRPLPPPRPVPAPAAASRGMVMAASVEMAPKLAPGAAPVDAMVELEEQVATVERGASAATYHPARPVAVPADGSAHRATVAVVELDAALDYVTAPVRSTDAHLRATVVNGSTHTLLPGRASVFHGGDFVGAVPLPVWAPGEEVELALGVDDRVRVERKLVRRTATKAALGSTRRRETEFKITIGNHTPGKVRVTLLDQLPVSRDDQISVRELRAEPEPAERTEMGVLTWRLELGPGETREVHLGFRVEVGKGVELAGWRE